ncbi:hypothetical protein M2451_000323 [Dysgonomonas sp. PFB1-18]|nr:hypothetical protein [Dysgonomonas sp. PF1-14]MDH6337792.1 hypothetical protein [Dysgonomonas sp. PF1-16]MDH6379016.1 hypothetical protein [Dysgonomonas sp. PFB1-18]MDH6396651.1 hypothetical protein [Dysgonomonas sp. PF1-23]
MYSYFPDCVLAIHFKPTIFKKVKEVKEKSLI